MDISGKHYDVSVLILTYEQDKQEVLLTLASAVIQKDVSFQIIISDDGSSVVYTNDYIQFMEKHNFEDYEIMLHESNQGTMENFKSAIDAAEGDYIKVICPGDCFTSDECLKLWLNDIQSKGSQLSFCDSVQYYKTEQGFQCMAGMARPQMPEVYNKRKTLQKKYYLLFNDIFLGAALLSERQITQKYAALMVDKVKYGEDNIYRLMILDGIQCSHFCHNAIFYEWGMGVSTKPNSPYARQLKADWEAVSQYIYDHCPDGYFGKKLRVGYSTPNEKRFTEQWFIRIMLSAELYIFNQRKKRKMRMTDIVSLDFLTYLEKMGHEYEK